SLRDRQLSPAKKGKATDISQAQKGKTHHAIRTCRKRKRRKHRHLLQRLRHRTAGRVLQPIASDDVAAIVTDVAVAEPSNGTIEIAGPERIRMDELPRRFLGATQDPRKVITDVHALYFGTELNDQSLVPAGKARLGPTRFEEWLSRTTPQKKAI